MSTATIDTPTTEATAPEAPTLRATVEQVDLAVALRWARHAIPSRPPVPILGCVLLEADRGALHVHGYDYDTSTTTAALAAGGSGRALVPLRLLASVVTAIGRRNTVRLEVEGDRLVVAGADVRYTLPTAPLDEYPVLPDPSTATHAVTLSGADLVDLARVTVAACTDQALPMICAVHLAVHDGRLEATATDRYRLMIADGPAVDEIPEEPWLVPARTLALLAREFRKEPTVTFAHLAEAPIGLTAGRLVATAGSRTLTSLLYAGDYPKTQSLFPDPATYTSVVTVDRDDLLLGMHQVGVVANRQAPVRLIAATDKLTLCAGSGDDAGATKTIPGALVGDARTVAIDERLLIGMLRQLPAGEVDLHQTATGKPVVITSREDPNLRCLLMPIRLGDTVNL